MSKSFLIPEYSVSQRCKPMDRNCRRGQGLIEYIAVTALVAIVSIGTVKLLGSKVRTHLNRVTNSFDRTVRNGLHAGRSSSSSDADESNDGDDTDSNPLPNPRGRNRVSLPGHVSLPW